MRAQFSACLLFDAWLEMGQRFDGRETLIRHRGDGDGRAVDACVILKPRFLCLVYFAFPSFPLYYPCHGSFLILRSSASTMLVVPLTPPTSLVLPASNRVQLMCFIPERTDQGSDVEWTMASQAATRLIR